MGIMHLDKHPMMDDIKRRIKDFSISEKVDGVNAVLGWDDAGPVLSRSMKGGRDFRDFPNRTWTRPFKSAFEVLRQLDIKPTQSEIMYGMRPNILNYDGKNRIVLMEPQNVPENVRVVVRGLPYTPDGKRIYRGEEEQNWEVAYNPRFTVKDFDELQELLTKPSRFGAERPEGFVLEDGDLTVKLVQPDFSQKNNEAWNTRRQIQRINDYDDLNNMWESYVSTEQSDPYYERTLSTFADKFADLT